MIQDPTATGGVAIRANPNNDVIIYAEGNVRVRGVVSADPDERPRRCDRTPGDTDDKLPRHVTIVTNGTAYIDGSLLRGNPESSIQVLAHDYVCVNTTQFLAGAIVDQNPAGTTQPGAFQRRYQPARPGLRRLRRSAAAGVHFGRGNGSRTRPALPLHQRRPERAGGGAGGLRHH